MKNHILKKLLNPLYKISACIIGYSIWYCIAATQQTSIVVSVPLCFYNIPNNHTILAPEEVSITLQAKRETIHTLDGKPLVAHIDGSTLHTGENMILLTPETLFLPNSIAVLHCNYSPIKISLEPVTSGIQSIKKETLEL